MQGFDKSSRAVVIAHGYTVGYLEQEQLLENETARIVEQPR